MATKTKRTASRLPVKAPRQRDDSRSRTWWLVFAGVLGLAVIGGVVYALGGESSSGTTEGLPLTPDYHSLLVAADDPQTLLLGTHNGLYRSTDGGRTWTAYTLQGQDAMNLARPVGDTIWTAGHLVFARSEDGGDTWADVRPDATRARASARSGAAAPRP